MEIYSGRFKKPICIRKSENKYYKKFLEYDSPFPKLTRYLPIIFGETYQFVQQICIKDENYLKCVIGRGFISSNDELFVIVFKDHSTGKFKIWVSDETHLAPFYKQSDRLSMTKIVTEFVNYYKKQADFIIEVQKHKRIQKFLHNQSPGIFPEDSSLEKRKTMLQMLKLENQFGVCK